MVAKRRRLSPFFDDDFDRLFQDMDSFHYLVDDMMRQHMGPHAVRAKLQPGQPLVYGFSMRVGPDGKPHVEQFGNVQQGKVQKEREPLVDIVDLKDEIRIVAELPGVQKEAIHIHVHEDQLDLDVRDSDRPFAKRIQLPAAVQDKTAQATYQNGILEVILKKKTGAGKNRVPVR
ncbi:Hsp20/alpha crystallin family protein [Candidatus Micrarchaeota archaeon]|nr:Hsp20/alpha crystallin family protein [Candidatus Micrarchaeota archaeon]